MFRGLYIEFDESLDNEMSKALKRALILFEGVGKVVEILSSEKIEVSLSEEAETRSLEKKVLPK
jgi:hypothetical protein